MKIVRVTKNLEMDTGTPYARKLKAGKSYIFSDVRAQQLQNVYSEFFGNSADINTIYKKYLGQSLDGKTLFVWRHGGIGDLMFMMPPLRILKQMYPTCKIWFASGAGFVDILRNLPYLDMISPLPVSTDWLTDSDYHLHFEGIIEGSKEAETINAYDLFLKRFCLDYTKIPPQNKIPDVYLTTEENKEAIELYEKFKFNVTDNIIIGIQLAASSPIRTYPVDRLTEITRHLVKRGCKIVLFGHPKKHAPISKNIRQSIEEETGISDSIISSPELNLPLRTSIALTRYLSLIIAPDSAFVHIAAAMHVPIVGLYGPFPADLRMRYYYDSIGLNADTPCSPCFTHGHNPCVKGSGPSPCFASLTYDIVLLAVDYILRKTKQAELTSLEEFKHEEFTKVLPECTEFMKGRGIDLGNGFTRYSEDYDVVRVDGNPLCDPDIMGNYFDVEVGNHYDYVISSFVASSTDHAVGIAKVAKEIMQIGGYFILYTADSRITSKIDTTFGKMHMCKDFFRSNIIPDEILKPIEEVGFELVKTVSGFDAWENEMYFAEDIIKLNYGFLSIWRRSDQKPNES